MEDDSKDHAQRPISVTHACQFALLGAWPLSTRRICGDGASTNFIDQQSKLSTLQPVGIEIEPAPPRRIRPTGNIVIYI